MAGEFFVDTSGFFALLNSDDPMHTRAKEFMATAARTRRRGSTTDWVVGECCTLLVARRKPHLVTTLLDITEGSAALAVSHLDRDFLQRTRGFLRRHLDHAYSFTDCASFVLMQESGVREALTTDSHFTEAGFTALLR